MLSRAGDRPYPGEGTTFTVETYPDRDEWLAHRVGGIGGSEAPALWGESAFDSAYSLWAKKRGLVPDAEETERMEIGTLEEPVAAELYRRRTGRNLLYPGPTTFFRSIRYPFLTVSVDRLAIGELRHTPGVVECKSYGESDAIPIAIAIQIQHALAVVGYEWGSAAMLLPFKRFRWGDLERDEAFIAQHIERCAAFWRAVEEGEPPEVDASEETAAALRRLHPRDDGAEVALPADAATWTATWDQAKDDRDMAETAARWAENKLRRAIGDAAIGRLPDGTALSLKTQKDGVRVLRHARKGT